MGSKGHQTELSESGAQSDETPFSLYDRLRGEGTLSEPNGIPDPRYALPSLVNWLRALAMVADDEGLDYTKACAGYAGVQRRSLCPQTENSVLEHLILGAHQLSALEAMTSVQRQADVARVAAVGWYYGLYAGATAMVAAQTGTVQKNHTKTAASWDRQLVCSGKVFRPFDLRVSTLVKAAADGELQSLRRGQPRNLVERPSSINDAHDILCGYLSGTVNWYRWQRTESIRGNELKEAGLSDFKTKQAKTLRDRALARKSVCFLHEAIRFRGKANYREALFLAHGTSVEATLHGFVSDMTTTLRAFLAMAGAFAFRRLGKTLRDGFLADLEKHRAFTLPLDSLWPV